MYLGLTDEHYKIAKENGISRQTAYVRWYMLGWSIEDSITLPIKARVGRRCKHRLYTDEEFEIMKKNQVSPNLFSIRLGKGWTRDKALNTRNRRGKW